MRVDRDGVLGSGGGVKNIVTTVMTVTGTGLIVTNESILSGDVQ